MPVKKTATVETIIATPEVIEVDMTPEPMPAVPEYDFDVDEPLIIKPQDLPLVVKPSAGKEWANREQAEYAMTLNGYAYKNPKKWQKKKAKLLSNLKRLGTDPEYINFVRGGEDVNTRLTYSNKLVEL